MVPGDLVKVKAATTLWKEHPNVTDVQRDQLVLTLGSTGVVLARGHEYVMVVMKETARVGQRSVVGAYLIMSPSLS